MNQLGKRIREIRIKKGMSERELAKKSGYRSEAMIRAIEQGTRTPSFNKNLDIAKALGVSVNELVGNKKGLTAKEKKVLGGISGYIENLPDEDIDLGVKVFRLIYDAYLGRRAKEELNKIKDKLSLEAHQKKYPGKGRLSETEEDERIFDTEKELKKIANKTCRIVIGVEGETYLTEIYFGSEIFAKEEGDCWDDNPARLAVSLLNNIFETVPRVLEYQEIDVYTDNEYLRKGINSWANTWKKNGWEKAGGGKVAFRKFWQRIVKIQEERRLKAHAK